MDRLLMKAASFFARIIRATLDVIAAALGVLYSAKYTTIVRRLGLPQIPPSEQRGFVLIQVDGLSYTHLEAAMQRGYASYLQRILRRGGFRLQAWQTGLPSTTPAVQAGIMYGYNEDIPAFRWYDKATGESIVCSYPSHVQAIQERISQKHRGILYGGSSFVNMFDGDASLSMFTLGAMNRKRFFESVRGFGFVLLFLLNPYRTLKTAALAIWEYLTEIYQNTSARLRRQTPRPLQKTFPFLRIMSNVVFRELQTFAVMVDIYRGAPAIYTTYYGYDELAHHYGPLSKPALRALRAIDARIRQIDGMRRRALTREYDLFVLSDHGLVAATPFARAYSQTLGELVNELIGNHDRLDETSRPERSDGLRTLRYLEDELRAIEANVRPPLVHIPQKMRQAVARRVALLREQDLATNDVPLGHKRLVVRNSGPTSHIYFDICAHQMDLSQVMAHFPGLIAELLKHQGIWLVIGREGEDVIVLSAKGALTLNGSYRVEGEDPLGVLANRHIVAEELRRLARFQHAGDLILVGGYRPEDEHVICFEEQWACHGGLGGSQESAFMITEMAIAWDLGQVTRSTELYPFFAERYGLPRAKD